MNQPIPKKKKEIKKKKRKEEQEVRNIHSCPLNGNRTGEKIPSNMPG
jgi:hypothetical protein